MLKTPTPLAVLSLTMLLFGCGGDNLFTGSAASVDVVGTYFLDSIDGEELPVVIASDGTGTAEITSAVLELTRERTFAYWATIRTTVGGVAYIDTVRTDGTYQVSSGTLSFIASNGNSGEMAIAGRALIEIVDGREFRYTR